MIYFQHVYMIRTHFAFYQVHLLLLAFIKITFLRYFVAITYDTCSSFLYALNYWQHYFICHNNIFRLCYFFRSIGLTLVHNRISIVYLTDNNLNPP